MNDQMRTKVLVVTGIMAMCLIMPSTPPSYAAGSANSPDVITKELKSGEKDKAAPVQRDDTQKDQDYFAGPLQDFHRDINRLFERTFRDFGFSSFDMDRPFRHTASGMFKPVADLSANDKEYTITVEVPGTEKEDIKIKVVNNVMTISGEKKRKKEEQKDFYRRERYYGAFQRVLSLPQDADRDHIKANFKQGVLTVTMPRKDMPEPDVQEITIHSD